MTTTMSVNFNFNFFSQLIKLLNYFIYDYDYVCYVLYRF